MPSRWVAALILSVAAAAQPPAVDRVFQRPTVGIVLKFEHRASERYRKHLQKTVAEIFQPTGLDLRWELIEPGSTPGQYDRAVVVEMKGRCSDAPLDAGATRERERVQLGWTLLHDGEVIPFSAVNCDELGRTARGAHRRLVHRQYLPSTYWRLMGRVFTHELLHALLRNPDHQQTDCARSPLRPLDIAIKVKLKPSEIAALRELGRAGRDAAVARTDSPAGPAERSASSQ